MALSGYSRFTYLPLGKKFSRWLCLSVDLVAIVHYLLWLDLSGLQAESNRKADVPFEFMYCK